MDFGGDDDHAGDVVEGESYPQVLGSRLSEIVLDGTDVWFNRRSSTNSWTPFLHQPQLTRVPGHSLRTRGERVA